MVSSQRERSDQLPQARAASSSGAEWVSRSAPPLPKGCLRAHSHGGSQGQSFHFLRVKSDGDAVEHDLGYPISTAVRTGPLGQAGPPNILIGGQHRDAAKVNSAALLGHRIAAEELFVHNADDLEWSRGWLTELIKQGAPRLGFSQWCFKRFRNGQLEVDLGELPRRISVCRSQHPIAPRPSVP